MSRRRHATAPYTVLANGVVVGELSAENYNALRRAVALDWATYARQALNLLAAVYRLVLFVACTVPLFLAWLLLGLTVAHPAGLYAFATLLFSSAATFSAAVPALAVPLYLLSVTAVAGLLLVAPSYLGLANAAEAELNTRISRAMGLPCSATIALVRFPAASSSSSLLA